MVAGALKTIRSSPNQPHNNTDTARASETVYETINETELINANASSLPCANLNISRRLQVHTIDPESVSVHGQSTNMQSLFNALRSAPNQSNVLFSNILQNENNKDSNSEASSTHSFRTSSVCLVYEAPYINHYHPLGMSCERVSHVYDEC